MAYFSNFTWTLGSFLLRKEKYQGFRKTTCLMNQRDEISDLHYNDSGRKFRTIQPHNNMSRSL